MTDGDKGRPACPEILFQPHIHTMRIDGSRYIEFCPVHPHVYQDRATRAKRNRST
jgi:hypothetical protein